MYTFAYESMGTHWEVTFDPHEVKSGVSAEDMKHEIIARSQRFDETYSRFIRSSLVWRIAEQAGVYKIPDDFRAMLELYLKFYEPSGYKLNPLIGFTISDLGYDDVYSLTEQEVVRFTPDLIETITLEGNTLITSAPVLFDVGALGKGYFVDRIVAYLKEQGCESMLVNGSGDVYYQGTEPTTIGLEDPRNASKVIGTTTLQKGALCASGINKRTWRDHHHVIDPHTRASVDNEVLATWVVAGDTATADALASCLFFVSPEALHEWKFEYVIMNKQGYIKKSPGWVGDFF